MISTLYINGGHFTVTHDQKEELNIPESKKKSSTPEQHSIAKNLHHGLFLYVRPGVTLLVKKANFRFPRKKENWKRTKET